MTIENTNSWDGAQMSRRSFIKSLLAVPAVAGLAKIPSTVLAAGASGSPVKTVSAVGSPESRFGTGRILLKMEDGQVFAAHSASVLRPPVPVLNFRAPSLQSYSHSLQMTLLCDAKVGVDASNYLREWCESGYSEGRCPKVETFRTAYIGYDDQEETLPIAQVFGLFPELVNNLIGYSDTLTQLDTVFRFDYYVVNERVASAQMGAGHLVEGRI